MMLTNLDKYKTALAYAAQRSLSRRGKGEWAICLRLFSEFSTWRCSRKLREIHLSLICERTQMQRPVFLNEDEK